MRAANVPCHWSARALITKATPFAHASPNSLSPKLTADSLKDGRMMWDDCTYSLKYPKRRSKSCAAIRQGVQHCRHHHHQLREQDHNQHCARPQPSITQPVTLAGIIMIIIIAMTTTSTLIVVCSGSACFIITYVSSFPDHHVNIHISALLLLLLLRLFLSSSPFSSVYLSIMLIIILPFLSKILHLNSMRLLCFLFLSFSFHSKDYLSSAPLSSPSASSDYPHYPLPSFNLCSPGSHSPACSSHISFLLCAIFLAFPIRSLFPILLTSLENAV